MLVSSTQSETLRVVLGPVYDIPMAEGGEKGEWVMVLSEGQLEPLADLVAGRMAGNPVHLYTCVSLLTPPFMVPLRLLTLFNWG